METHANYIHFNPVKHQFVKYPIDWKNSSMHNYHNNDNNEEVTEDKINFEIEYGE